MKITTKNREEVRWLIVERRQVRTIDANPKDRKQISIGELKQTFGVETDILVKQAVQQGKARAETS